MIRLGHTAQASGTGRRPTPTTAPRGHREALTREIHGLVERRSQRAIGRTSVSGRKTDQMNQNVTSWSSGRRYRPASAPAIATPLTDHAVCVSRSVNVLSLPASNVNVRPSTVGS